MFRTKKTLFFLIILLCLVNILPFFRWHYTFNENEMKYKIDRWTNKTWVEFYPPLASGSPMEFPVTSDTKYDSYTQLESYVQKTAISGDLVSSWVKRMQLTHIYYGINLLLVLFILTLLRLNSSKN